MSATLRNPSTRPATVPLATAHGRFRGTVIIRGGRLIDPARGIDAIADVAIRDGRVVDATADDLRGERVFDARGLVVAPGFVDLHAHLRQPGYEYRETIATGTSAAIAGGFTTVCAMPNTEPATDSPAVVEQVLQTARREASARVYVIGAITRGRKGKALADMIELGESGVVAFSDDGDCVTDPSLMRHALAYSVATGRPVVQHAEEKALTTGAQMHEGMVSARLGLPGWPRQAETSIVARDCELAALTGAHLHVAHVSAADTLDFIRRAKGKGTRVTAEVTPHHLTLTDDLVGGHWWSATAWLPPYDTRTKVNPPLREPDDRDAMVEGLRDGTIDCVATDHAPHGTTDKQVEYAAAASGISNLETALGSVLRLVHAGSMSLFDVVSSLTARPANVFGLEAGTLASSAPGDVVVFDPDREWCVDPAQFASKGRNTPLAGHILRGRVIATIVGGEVLYDRS
jgi:dihydroorotase